MFNKILIANRGEIACRVIRTAKRLGIHTVAVYSDADQNALHVKQADEAIHIGPSPSSESYLLGEKIIQAALKTGAQAIHPGYGFLSENAGFAQDCASNNITFIGPPSKAIQAMGSKSAAKTIMQEADVPLVPGYHGDDQNPALLKQHADDMGYPVLLKAVAGGGGKGMRQVWTTDEFDQALGEAKRESLASFANDDMLVEKYLTQPRHVEFQIFCDQHGNGVYLFERDCSVQRRHQKIIEEAPAPGMSEELRKEMGDTAVRAAQAIDYQGAGTVEFLLDADGSFYFMEMNTRLQVEHPVTEMITGEDLVEWQLSVAAGQDLPKTQDELTINGHAFEARIYAEDPSADFMPTAGTLTSLRTPQQSKHIRIDTGVAQGDEVSPFYDPMIAKLVVWDENRNAALTRTAAALREYQITGITTNLKFLYDLASCAPFQNADLDTGFIEKHSELLFSDASPDLPTLLAQAAMFLALSDLKNNGDNPWQSKTGWRLNQANRLIYTIQLGQDEHVVNLEVLQAHAAELICIVTLEAQTIKASGKLTDAELSCNLSGHTQKVRVVESADGYVLFGEHGSSEFSLAKPDLGEDSKQGSENAFIAPMNGTVIEVLVNAGDSVSAGEALIIMEAMKMQHTMEAPCDGQVSELFCAAGELVDGGKPLLEFVTKQEQR